MGCEESFITMKFIWHSYLVLSLGNRAHETSTETGLSPKAHLILIKPTSKVRKDQTTPKWCRHNKNIFKGKKDIIYFYTSSIENLVMKTNTEKNAAGEGGWTDPTIFH